MPRNKTKPPPSSRRACFTLNNPTVTATELIDSVKARVRFIVFQLELAPVSEKHTPHYQGYVEWKNAMTTSAMTKAIPHCSFKFCNGTPQENYNYCTDSTKRADGDQSGPWEYGTMSNPGARNDIVALYELAKSGTPAREAAEMMPATYARYHKAFQHIASLYPPIRGDKVAVHLLLGPTSTGKTFATRSLPRESVWTNSVDKGTWFDGYDGHENAVFDEYKGHISLTLFLKLLHEYTERVPTKGSHTWWTPKRIIITSNFHPDRWYDYTDREEHRIALYRRIHYVWEFDGINKPQRVEGLDYFNIRDKIQNINYFDIDLLQ